MYKPIGTIFGTLFVIDDNVELFWVTFDPSAATLSINTLCLRVHWQVASCVDDCARIQGTQKWTKKFRVCTRHTLTRALVAHLSTLVLKTP